MAAICLLISQISISHATSLIFPGDIAYRHYLTRLSDHAVLLTPMTSWPVTVKSLSDAYPTTGTKSDGDWVALNYLGKAAEPQGVSAAIGYANRFPAGNRFGFPNQPSRFLAVQSYHERGSLQVGFSLAAEQTASRAESLRWDGSYMGVTTGNWFWSINKIPRWWGPGWGGSLIFSNNVEPIPAISVERISSRAFQHPWLHWLGAWQLSTGLARLESNRVIPNALLFFARLVIKPLADFELGLSRTAQWGGAGRPRSAATFFRMLAGLDNVGDDGTTSANEPGNQLAGFDIRWRIPYINSAFYAQLIGED